MMQAPDEVVIRLANEALWRQFQRVSGEGRKGVCEMIITRRGRRMFPKLEFEIRGLEPSTEYGLSLVFERTDDHRYKFVAGSWIPSGRADPRLPTHMICHQDGPRALGSHWMKAPVCFDRVRLTNNPQQPPVDTSLACLQSMHKYQPVLSIFRIRELQPPLLIRKISFELAEFVAVTAYQNQTVTLLKIEHNPFAKGFRDGGHADRKRQSLSASPDSEEALSPKAKRSSPHEGLPLPSHTSLGELPVQPPPPASLVPTPWPPYGFFPQQNSFIYPPFNNHFFNNRFNNF